jgi:hypothetical protein
LEREKRGKNKRRVRRERRGGIKRERNNRVLERERREEKINAEVAEIAEGEKERGKI